MFIKFGSISTKSFFSFVLFAVVVRLSSAQQSPAAVDQPAALAPFLSGDTFAVAYVDVKSIDPDALVTKLATLLNMPPTERQQADAYVAAAKEFATKLRAAGVGQVFVVAGVEDIATQTGPLAVLPISDAKAAAAREPLQTFFNSLPRPAPGYGSHPLTIERHPSGVLVVGLPDSIARYAKAKRADRPDLTAPLARLMNNGATAAAVLSPGPDARRVIRELFPALPAPFAALDGGLLADHTKQVEFMAKLEPTPAAQLAVETTDAQAAAAFRQAIDAGRGLLTMMAVQDPANVGAAATLAGALNLQTQGERVTVSLPTDKAQLVAFSNLLEKSLAAARESAARQQRMLNLKRLGLAIANYESANKRMPPAAIRDANGKPLLSWRVAVLPFMDDKELALYKEFHLDEPWDSPHNRELVKKMPAVFADPDPKLAELVKAGKTTFQAPVGPDTVFCKNEGIKISEIADGTSNTITIVEVVPERAVEWTWPADWDVDMDKPLDGVRRADRNGFAAAFADAHVVMLMNDIAPAKFRAMLTRAGKEVIDR